MNIIIKSVFGIFFIFSFYFYFFKMGPTDWDAAKMASELRCKVQRRLLLSLKVTRTAVPRWQQNHVLTFSTGGVDFGKFEQRSVGSTQAVNKMRPEQLISIRIEWGRHMQGVNSVTASWLPWDKKPMGTRRHYLPACLTDWLPAFLPSCLLAWLMTFLIFSPPVAHHFCRRSWLAYS